MNAINFFTNESLNIFELRSSGVPCSEPKNKKYQWFLINEGKIIKLNFIEMGTSNDTNYRIFEQGKLVYNDTSAEFNGIKLKNNTSLLN